VEGDATSLKPYLYSRETVTCLPRHHQQPLIDIQLYHLPAGHDIVPQYLEPSTAYQYNELGRTRIGLGHENPTIFPIQVSLAD